MIDEKDPGPWIIWEGWVCWTSSHKADDTTWEQRLHQAWCRVTINNNDKISYWQRYTWDGSAPKDMCSWMPVSEMGSVEAEDVATCALRELFHKQNAPLETLPPEIIEAAFKSKAGPPRIKRAGRPSRMTTVTGTKGVFDPAAEIEAQSVSGRILEWVYDNGPELRVNLAKKIKASSSTVSQQARKLIREGWLKENEDFTLSLARELDCLPPKTPIVDGHFAEVSE